MTETQDIPLNDKAPPSTQIVRTEAAGVRGKENRLRPADQEGEFTALFSKKVKKPEPGSRNIRDNIGGLEREYQMLQVLRDSGVTPEPLALHVNNDRTEAQLLMKGVKGESIDHMSGDSPEVQARFGEMMISTLAALDAVHQKGILIRDVNKGTFIVDGLTEHAESLTTSVVDFELAVREGELTDPRIADSASHWYQGKDMGFARAYLTDKSLNPDDAYSSERHIAALQLLERVIGSDVFSVDIDQFDPALREALSHEQSCIQDDVEALTRKRITEEWEERREDDPEGYTTSLEEEMGYSLKSRTQANMSLALLHLTFPTYLQQRGIKLDPILSHYLASVLSPDMEVRPTRTFSAEEDDEVALNEVRERLFLAGG